MDLKTYARYDPQTGDLSTQTMPPNEPDCMFWEVSAETDINLLYVRGDELFFAPPPPSSERFWCLDADTETWVDGRSQEAKWRAIRAERDRLLLACDWTQVPDAPLNEAEREAWRAYRQTLRDMPETTEDPAQPIWPTVPTT